MPIEIKTVYTKERLLRFSYYVFGRKLILNILYLILGIFALLTLIAGAILDVLTIEIALMLSVGLLIVLAYFLLNLLLPQILVRKANNLNTDINYSFSEENLSIIAENSLINENTNIKYDIFKKIVKYKNELYLFIEKYQAFIVDLSETDEEIVSTLKALLSTKVAHKKFKWK